MCSQCAIDKVNTGKIIFREGLSAFCPFIAMSKLSQADSHFPKATSQLSDVIRSDLAVHANKFLWCSRPKKPIIQPPSVQKGDESQS